MIGVSTQRARARDTGGEVTAAVVTDAHGNVIAQCSRELDLLARTTALVGAAGQRTQVNFDSIGDPTTKTDPSGSTVWTYDANNELQTKQQTIGSLSRTLGVVRDALGRPTQVTYPSGAVVSYTWTNGLVTALAVNGQAVLQQVRYLSMGTTPIGWTWGNGLAQERSIDRDGQVTAVTIGAARQTNTFDAAGRITRQLDTAAGGGILVERQFGYDASGRLTSYLSSVGDGQSFSYDKAGNRKQLSDASGSTNYDFDFAAPYRIVKVNPPGLGNRRDFTYDAAGNTTSDGLRSYTYNSFGRLSRVTVGTTTVDSTYNGQGLRVRKVATVNGVPTTTRYFYDDTGHLLGEYYGSEALIQETVWFAGMPVATIRPDGVYYVQADHLGTPRAVLRPADNAVMWRWDSNPFGSTPAQEASIGGSTFKYNLRFPGQYLDAETGLHYNVFRDYDPGLGRYVQSDPIGLGGGINTYAYAGGNPLSYIDSVGLAPPANVPSGVNISQNAIAAQNMSVFDFFNAVRPGGIWDYKLQGTGGRYEDFGNYNYGVVGVANGWSSETLERAAGAVQIFMSAIGQSTYSTSWSWPLGSPPYGDQPKDNFWIREGANDYLTGLYTPGRCPRPGP